MTAVDEMSPVARFLYLRLAEPNSEWVGVSSNAMVAAALSGATVDDRWNYPHDLADLSRCCATFARAPWELKKLMLPILADYCEHARGGFDA